MHLSAHVHWLAPDFTAWRRSCLRSYSSSSGCSQSALPASAPANLLCRCRIRASLPPQPPKPKPPPEPKPKKVYDYTTPWAQIKKIRRIKALPAKKREKALKKLDQRQAAKDRVKAEKEAARAQAKAERAAEKARHRIERIWDMPSSSGSDGMHDA